MAKWTTRYRTSDGKTVRVPENENMEKARARSPKKASGKILTDEENTPDQDGQEEKDEE